MIFIKTRDNYQSTLGNNNFIMQQMSLIALKVKNSILIIQKNNNNTDH